MEKLSEKNQKKTKDKQAQIIESQLLSGILESSSSVSIISTDLDQNIIYWNKGAENIFGYKAEEIVGKRKITIIYNGVTSKKTALKAQKKIKTTKKGTECELQQITKSGEVLWSKMTLTPSLDEKGNVIGILGVGTDITKHKSTEAHLRKLMHQLKKTLTGIIYATELIIETRDPYTAGHQKRVALLAKAIAENMKLSDHQIEGIFMIGMIHDLGKISIPAEILSIPRRLTEAEFNLIKNHPEAGYDILKTIDFPWPIAEIILQHHERLDGTGYPNRLVDKEIMLEAKVIMVADVVEAMASHRPYRAAFGIQRALGEIKQNSGILYDSTVVNACVDVFEKEKFKFENNESVSPLLTSTNELSKM
ncbi:MAG: PAS domain S-box protein [Candidatus Cloacimonetes bacterium]|nr:PAS domain S-box protein [Candidatus Cloacimonadota bacterium]